MRLTVDSGRTPMSAAQVASVISNIFQKLYNWQLTFKKIKFEPKNPVRRRGKAISFFLRPVGVLKISKGVEHDPEAEPHVESYRDFDLKNRFSFGNVPTATFFQ